MGYLMQDLLYTLYVYECGGICRKIVCRKFYLHIVRWFQVLLFIVYTQLIWLHSFALVWFYDISPAVGHLMPNYLYTYILNIYMISFGWLLWYIDHCWLFNAKSSLYIYIKYIWFALLWFYGISTIVGYLMLNPLYLYILNLYDLILLGFIAYQQL